MVTNLKNINKEKLLKRIKKTTLGSIMGVTALATVLTTNGCSKNNQKDKTDYEITIEDESAMKEAEYESEFEEIYTEGSTVINYCRDKKTVYLLNSSSDLNFSKDFYETLNKTLEQENVTRLFISNASSAIDLKNINLENIEILNIDYCNDDNFDYSALKDEKFKTVSIKLVSSQVDKVNEIMPYINSENVLISYTHNSYSDKTFNMYNLSAELNDNIKLFDLNVNDCLGNRFELGNIEISSSNPEFMFYFGSSENVAKITQNTNFVLPDNTVMSLRTECVDTDGLLGLSNVKSLEYLYFVDSDLKYIPVRYSKGENFDTEVVESINKLSGIKKY